MSAFEKEVAAVENRDPYGFEYCGDCLGGIIPPGTMLLAGPDEEIRPLQIVSVLLRNFDGPWARFVNALSGEGFAGLVKVYLGTYEAANGEAVYLLGQINPPTIALIPASAVTAIDRVAFVDGTAATIDADDRAALSLLTTFAVGEVKKEAA